VGHGPGRRDFFDFEGDRVGLVHTTQMGSTALPLRSFKITIGVLVTGSIMSPRIFISTSMALSPRLHYTTDTVSPTKELGRSG